MTDSGQPSNAPGESEQRGLADLKRRSVQGGVLTVAARGASIAVQVVSTVVLARLLTPEDYGIVGMVAAVTAFAALFRDLGLSAAAIQKKDLSHEEQTNLFWVNAAAGAVLTMLVALMSPAVAWYYKKPEVLWVTVAVSLNLIIRALGAQPNALLLRELRFGPQAVTSITGALISLVVSIVLALLDYGYWALVWGGVVGAATTTVLLFTFSGFRPGLPSMETDIRRMLSFGAHVTLFDFTNYFHRNLDNLLIGRVWGAASLGLYTRAYSLFMLPISGIRGPINAVAFPAMSQLLDRPDAYRAYFRRVVSVVSFLSMPLAAYLFVVAEPFITLALGAQWLGVVPIFSVLAVAGFLQPVAGLRGLVMLSTERGRAYVTWGIINAVAVSIAFLVGTPFGPVGIASAYAITTYILLYPSLLLAFKDTPVVLGDFFRPIARPTAASIGAAALTALAASIAEDLGVVPVLVICTITLLGAYLVIYWLVPGGADELRALARLRTHLRIRTPHPAP